MNEHRTMLYLACASLAVLLLLLVLTIMHRRRLNQISDQLAEGAVDNGETLKGVVERENDRTRLHVSHAVDTISHHSEMTKVVVREFVEQQTRDAKEFRGQLTVHKTRLQWIIGVVDKLAAQIREVFHGKQPPP